MPCPCSAQAAEIKRATAAVSAVKSELAKLEEQLEECSRCAAFLHRLTPPEWLADRAAARAATWQVTAGSFANAGWRVLVGRSLACHGISRCGELGLGIGISKEQLRRLCVMSRLRHATSPSYGWPRECSSQAGASSAGIACPVSATERNCHALREASLSRA